jgi:small subunit ribosomal protein S8
MAVNDTIADMLTRIRNANLARHQTTEVPSTKMTRSIATVLKAEGFIGEFEEVGEGVKKHLVISLKYKGKGKRPIITGSTPTGKSCPECWVALASRLFPPPAAS